MDILDSVIKTLNTIHVSGEDDMSKLLGCIHALRSLKENETGEAKE